MHGVRFVDSDCGAKLSKLRFVDEIILIRGSLKQMTTMLDDFITAITAHACNYNPREQE